VKASTSDARHSEHAVDELSHSACAGSKSLKQSFAFRRESGGLLFFEYSREPIDVPDRSAQVVGQAVAKDFEFLIGEFQQALDAAHLRTSFLLLDFSFDCPRVPRKTIHSSRLG
jgi:hypothetical protein